MKRTYHNKEDEPQRKELTASISDAQHALCLIIRE